MYAVIRTGGKQYKVAPGDVIEIERVKDSSGTLSFTPLLVVDDDGRSTSGRSALQGATVDARILHESRGPKTEVLKFRNKSGYRRHNGHRQTYTSVEISGIKLAPQKS
jgi:large subunit ribosomal protein L21